QHETCHTVHFAHADRSCRDHPHHDVKQGLPVLPAYKNDWHRIDLLGLDECQYLKEFVEGAQPAGQYHKGTRMGHQHHLSDKEVAERDGPVYVVITVLLK